MDYRRRSYFFDNLELGTIIWMEL